MSKEELRELQKKIEDIMEKFIEQVESVEIKAPRKQSTKVK